MESAGEDLDDIFDEHESRENNGDGQAPENIGESNNENSAGVRVQPPKRVVKNPRLKFNPERLIGERGIPVLIEHFKDVKFKGKGHEKEDLDKLLSKLEHWTHRLFPSMKFEDCLHQIEKLGTKRPVQTCLRKIRLDMPILASDFVKDDEEDNVQRNEDAEPVEADPFDQLLGENFSSNRNTADEDMVGFNPLPSYSPPQRNPPESRGQVLGSSTSSLTDEQKERLERNRMLAVERRKAKLAALEQKSSEVATESSQCDTPDGPTEQSFDSLLENKESKSEDIHESNSQSNIEENNLNSDNLGLDDLMDLVDEEVVVDTNAVFSVPHHDQSGLESNENGKNISVNTNETNDMEINKSNLENMQSCNETDMTLENKAVHNDHISAVAGENLQLESLIDLHHDQSDLECNKNSKNISVNTNKTNDMEINMSNLENTQICNETDMTHENKAVHNDNISAVAGENLQLKSLIDLHHDQSDLEHNKNSKNMSVNTNDMEINTSNISAVAEENLQLESLIDLVNEGEDYQNSSSFNCTEDMEAMDYKDGNS